MAPRIIDGSAGLKAVVGEHLGYSDWMDITQERVNLFAEGTGDHQWIHVDAERAAKGPFGTTIAHGFLTLSLLPEMSASAMEVRGTRMGVNYGLNKVRFTSPVPVGSRLRGRMKLLACEPIAPFLLDMASAGAPSSPNSTNSGVSIRTESPSLSR